MDSEENLPDTSEASKDVNELIESVRYLNSHQQYSQSLMMIIHWILKLDKENQNFDTTIDSLKETTVETTKNYMETEEINENLIGMLYKIYENDLEISNLYSYCLLKNEKTFEALSIYKSINSSKLSQFDQIKLHRWISDTRTHLFDQWHWKMINDGVRNRAFWNGIKEVLSVYRKGLKGSTDDGILNILDLGCGTGILSVMTDKIVKELNLLLQTQLYALDSSHTFHQIAAEVFKANKTSAHLYNCHSNDFHPKSKVNICITETLDCAIFGEKMCSSVLDIQKRIGADDFTVIPGKATLYMAVIECEQLEKQNFFEKNGKTLISEKAYLNKNFSSSRIPGFPQPYDAEYLENMKFEYLSEPIKAFSIDFNDVSQLERVVNKGVFEKVQMKASKNGRASAVIAWFECHLTDSISFSTQPGQNSCWPQAIFPLYPSRQTQPNLILNFQLIIRNEQVFLNPLDWPDYSTGLPREIYRVEEEDCVNFEVMNNRKLRMFFEEKIKKISSENPNDVVIDLTDLALQSEDWNVLSWNENKVKLLFRDQPEISQMPKAPHLALIWPFNHLYCFDQHIIFQKLLPFINHHITPKSIFPSKFKLFIQAINSDYLSNASRILEDSKKKKEVYCGVEMDVMKYCNIQYFEDIDLNGLLKRGFEEISEETKVLTYSIDPEFKDQIWKTQISLKLKTDGNFCDGLLFWLQLEDGDSKFCFKNDLRKVRAFLFGKRHKMDGDTITVEVSVSNDNFTFYVPEILESSNNLPEVELSFGL